MSQLSSVLGVEKEEMGVKWERGLCMRCRLVLQGHRDKLGPTLYGSVWAIIPPHTSAPTQIQ